MQTDTQTNNQAASVEDSTRDISTSRSTHVLTDRQTHLHIQTDTDDTVLEKELSSFPSEGEFSMLQPANKSDGGMRHPLAMTTYGSALSPLQRCHSRRCSCPAGSAHTGCAHTHLPTPQPRLVRCQGKPDTAAHGRLQLPSLSLVHAGS